MSDDYIDFNEDELSENPSLIINVLNQLLEGDAVADMSSTLQQCVVATRKTMKESKMDIKLTVKPLGDGQYTIACITNAKLPAASKSTLFFGTPEGNLQRENPRQKKLDLKSVDEPERTLIDVEQQ